MKKSKEIGKVVLLPIEKIVPNPFQPRKAYSQRELLSLSDSIRQNGVMQPITVRKVKDSFELVSGERRLRASKEAGLSEIPAIIISADEEKSAILALIENMQRENLNCFETAAAIKTLIDKFSFTRAQAAESLSISTPALSNKLRILSLSEQEKELIISSGLHERHARALLKIEDEALRLSALKFIIKKEMNVAAAESYIDTLITPKIKRRHLVFVKDVRLFLNTINKAVDTMKKAGINADVKKECFDDYIEFSVKIPTASAAKAQ